MQNQLYFLQPDQCSCQEYSFGSVNDILTVSSNLYTTQPVAKEINCPQSKLKIPELHAQESCTIKVIVTKMIVHISNSNLNKYFMLLNWMVITTFYFHRHIWKSVWTCHSYEYSCTLYTLIKIFIWIFIRTSIFSFWWTIMNK